MDCSACTDFQWSKMLGLMCYSPDDVPHPVANARMGTQGRTSKIHLEVQMLQKPTQIKPGSYIRIINAIETTITKRHSPIPAIDFLDPPTKFAEYQTQQLFHYRVPKFCSSLKLCLSGEQS